MTRTLLVVFTSMAMIVTVHSKAVRGPLSQRVDSIERENLMLKQHIRKFCKTQSNTVHTNMPVQDIVAFTGVLTRTITLGSQQALIYNKVLLNVGNGYNVKSGHFVAPVAGIYTASVSLMGYQTNSVYLQLVKDGKELVRLWTHKGIHKIGTQTIAVQLRKNEVVWVRRLKGAGGTIYGSEPYNTFSVVLVAS